MTDNQKELSEAGRLLGQAGRKHGIYSFRDRGPDALAQDQKSLYIELRDQFKSEPGRLEFRELFAAHLAMMLELGFSDLKDQAEKGRGIWNSPPVTKMGTYVNALIRLLDSWPKESKDKKNILDLMQGEKYEQRKSTGN